jgi:hypothetical protein
VGPLANGFELDLELSEALSPDAGPNAVELMRVLAKSESPSAAVVLCTHREVIAEALPPLSRQFSIKLGHRLPGAKGGLWVLDFRKANLVTVKYRPPTS